MAELTASAFKDAARSRTAALMVVLRGREDDEVEVTEAIMSSDGVTVVNESENE